LQEAYPKQEDRQSALLTMRLISGQDRSDDGMPLFAPFRGPSARVAMKPNLEGKKWAIQLHAKGASGDRALSVLRSQRLTLALPRAGSLAGYPVGQPGSGKQCF
jgi:hypothetical protein